MWQNNDAITAKADNNQGCSKGPLWQKKSNKSDFDPAGNALKSAILCQKFSQI